MFFSRSLLDYNTIGSQIIMAKTVTKWWMSDYVTIYKLHCITMQEINTDIQVVLI